MGIILREEWFGGIVGDTHSYNIRVLNRYTFNLLKDYTHKTITNETRKLISLLKSKDIEVNERLRIIKNSAIGPSPILSAPIIVWLEITDKCSLKCKQCFLDSKSLNKNNTLSLELLEKIIFELYETGVYKVTITGGEPLLYKGLPNLLTLLNEKDIGIRIFTNGLVPHRNIEMLNNFKIDILFLSLDGWGIDNDVFRGRFSFNKIISSLKYLVKLSNIANVTASLTLNKRNIKNLEPLFQMASDIGVKTFLTRPLLIYPWSKNLKSDFHLTKEELVNALLQLDELSCKYKVEYQINKIPFIPIKKKIFHDDKPSNASLWNILKVNNNIDCVGGNLVCGIRSDGIVIPCGFIKLLYESNEENSILKKNFAWLWKHSPNLNKLRNIKPNVYCKKCKLLQVCNGGCRANSDFFHGNKEGIDQYCIFHKTSFGGRLASEQNITFKDFLYTKKFINTSCIYVSDSVLVSKCGWSTLEAFYE